jgi:hypothetical protein
VVAYAARLGCATGRVGLRVEVEDHGLPAQAGEPDQLAVLVRKLEVGRLLSSRYHAGVLSSLIGGSMAAARHALASGGTRE